MTADDTITDHLLWLDLETTGSDETAGDCIIEVGCVLTTHDLEEVSEFSHVVQPEPLGLGRMLQNEVVRTMHETNGLLADVLDAKDEDKIHHVTREILTWLQECGAEQGKLVLAGSGVGHFDRRFIKRWMPQLDKAMRYWCIDIGVVRRAYQMWATVPYETTERGQHPGKTHRALDDARCHLEEARAFARLWMTP